MLDLLEECTNYFPAVLSPAHPLPPVCVCVSRSESVLELSIMPKDEDVLQLVSARLTRARHISSQHCRKSNIPAVIFDTVTVKECADHLRHGCRVTQPLSSVFSSRHAFIKSITTHVWKAVRACLHSRATRYFFTPAGCSTLTHMIRHASTPPAPPVTNPSTPTADWVPVPLARTGHTHSHSKSTHLRFPAIF